MAARKILSVGDDSIRLLEPIHPHEVKVGMVIHHVEHFAHGVTIQFTGPISAIGRTREGRPVALMRGLPYEEVKRVPLWTEDYRVVDD